MNIDTLMLKDLAKDWISAWNDRDLTRIMEHYSDNVVFYAPSVIARWHFPDGKIEGKAQLRAHFLKGLELAPDLNFDLIEVLPGIDGMCIIYKREYGTTVADVVTIDDNGKASVVKVYMGQ